MGAAEERGGGGRGWAGVGGEIPTCKFRSLLQNCLDCVLSGRIELARAASDRVRGALRSRAGCPSTRPDQHAFDSRDRVESSGKARLKFVG